MIAVQLAKKMDAKVIAVSKHNWIKDSEFGGADHLISDYNSIQQWDKSQSMEKIQAWQCKRSDRGFIYKRKRRQDSFGDNIEAKIRD